MEDLGKAAMEAELADFAGVSAGADIAVVFYAGHGMEVDRQNHLILVDARLTTDRRLRFETISLDDVLVSLEAVRGVRIVLLDACRNNPFSTSTQVSSQSRSIGRGLSRVEAASGTLISFAAKEGRVVEDGDGRNSPFTAALLADLNKPGVEIGFLFRKVRDSVLAATNGTQEPYVSASLPGNAIFLIPSQAEPDPVPEPPAARPELAIAKTGPAECALGRDSTWSIRVMNNGPGEYAGVLFVDDSPPGGDKTALERYSSGWKCGQAGGGISCRRGFTTLAAGQSVGLDLT